MRLVRFMIIRKADKDTEAGKLPSADLITAMMRYNEEMAKAGIFLDGAGLQPSSRAARVKSVGGTRTVVDGPFTEAKELIAGFTMIQARTLQEAVEWVKRWPLEDGDVELEIRQVLEAEDMSTTVFLAGATGVVGRRLVPLLRAAGYSVIGTTRSAAKASGLEQQGATPVVVDVLNAEAIMRAVTDARPTILIHQLTDLPVTPGAAGFEATLERTARLRIEGTANLMAAARAAGVTRVIAQSVAFLYAPGDGPRLESDPVMTGGVATGAVPLERAVLETPGIEGIVLRYGYFYGPDTWSAVPRMRPALHVDDAAHAAMLALTRGAPGIYNIADDDGAVSIEKARRELGFEPVEKGVGSHFSKTVK
jgi:nucleoside-diphosphate-sugar epimerase